MFNKKKKNKTDISGFNSRKLADKRSVFDSDFIGREGKLNPRTVKEVAMAVGLCTVLTTVFYLNFYHRKSAADTAEKVSLADPAVLNKINFDSPWQHPDRLPQDIRNPMLDTNKLLAYQRKYGGEIQEPITDEKQSGTSVVQTLKKITIALKGVLWDADGQSTALIDREMLRENQRYRGYTVAEVLRQSVVLTDDNGNRIRLNVGEIQEIIATETSEIK